MTYNPGIEISDCVLNADDLEKLSNFICDPNNWELNSRGRMLYCPTTQFIMNNLIHLSNDDIHNLIYLCTLKWDANRLPQSKTYKVIYESRIKAKEKAKIVNTPRKRLALLNTINILEYKLEKARSELRKIS